MNCSNSWNKISHLAWSLLDCLTHNADYCCCNLQQQLETLTKQKQELEQVQAQLTTLKDEAEKQEQEAYQRHAQLSHGFWCLRDYI